MFTLILSALSFHRVDLDRLSIERARQLDGRRVIAVFMIAKHVYSERGVTTAGAADQPDGAEGGAVLRGRRYDLDEGQRVAVVGTLHVPNWPPTFIGDVQVPAWAGIEVREES